jgi:hypothetical protein
MSGAGQRQAALLYPGLDRTVAHRKLWLTNNAMVAIERAPPPLKGTLPKDDARPALDKPRLGELIDLIGRGDAEHRSNDVVGGCAFLLPVSNPRIARPIESGWTPVIRLVARIEHPSHKARKTVARNSCFRRFAMASALHLIFAYDTNVLPGTARHRRILAPT